MIRRATNGGISQAKNTCLRALLGERAEAGFLAEDDILFAEGWADAYPKRCNAREFSISAGTRPMTPTAWSSATRLWSAATAGLWALMSFYAPEVIAIVGGFKFSLTVTASSTSTGPGAWSAPGWRLPG